MTTAELVRAAADGSRRIRPAVPRRFLGIDPGRYMTPDKPITVAFSVFIRRLASALTRVMAVVIARSRSIPSGG